MPISSIYIGSVNTASVSRLLIVKYGVNVFDRYLIGSASAVTLQVQCSIATFKHSSRPEPTPRNSLIHCQHSTGKRKDTDWGGECKIDEDSSCSCYLRPPADAEGKRLSSGHESDIVGYDSIRAMIEMGIVYELVLPNRRKQYTVLISYDEQATSNTLSHVQTP